MVESITKLRHELNVVIVDDEVRFKEVSAFVKEVARIRRRGFDEVRIDFTKCLAAFSDGMVPLITQVDALRSDGVDVFIVLPEKDYLRHLFVKANWAHFLEPDRHNFINASPYNNNYPLHRFSTSCEQTEVVNGLIEVVMKTLRLSRDVLQGLEWSFNEITDNVLNHAQSGSGLAQAMWYPQRGQVLFTVADSGIGVLASLREGLPALQTDREALGEAIKAGVTRNPKFGQGNGLAGALRIATLTGGQFS